MSMEFEVVCINNLMNNADFSRKVLAYLQPEYFEHSGTKTLFGLIADFTNKFNEPPTIDAIVVMLANMELNESVHADASEILSSCDVTPGNTEFLVEQAEAWAKDRSLYEAIQKAILIYDEKGKLDSRISIPDILTKALTVNFDSHLGHDYFAEAEAQFEFYHSDEDRIPFDLDALNKVTKGGVRRRTLNVVQAGINVGKTTFLVHQAAHWLAQGKNVMYFTLEIGERETRERVDASVLGVTFDQLHSMEKLQYLGRVNKLKAGSTGQLKIKEFPTSGAHIGHFRHVLNEFKTKQGFLPDLIIVDYLTIVMSSRLTHTGNSNNYYQSVAAELRALAFEWDVPLWTAAQFNRGGQSSTNVGMEDIAESIGIAATADFMLALMQPDELASSNQIIAKVLKNRYANKSKLRSFLLGLDNDMQKLSDVDQNTPASGMTKEEIAEFESTSSKPGDKTTNKFEEWSFN